MKFYKTLYIPSKLYGSEASILTTKDEANIQSFEIRFLRTVTGYRLINQKRNADIRHELQINSLNQQVQYRSQWSEHIERMPDERLPKKLSQYRARNKRNLGRPKKRWKDSSKI